MIEKIKACKLGLIAFVIILCLGFCALVFGDTIGGSYSVIKNTCQSVTVKYTCGSCGKSTGNHSITWPSEHTTSTKYFTCTGCKKRNKVTLNGKKWPCP